MGKKGRKNRSADVPAYLDALGQLAGTVKAGTVQHVEIRHDSWCDQLNGRGLCNCKPDVNLVKPS